MREEQVGVGAWEEGLHKCRPGDGRGSWVQFTDGAQAERQGGLRQQPRPRRRRKKDEVDGMPVAVSFGRSISPAAASRGVESRRFSVLHPFPSATAISPHVVAEMLTESSPAQQRLPLAEPQIGASAVRGLVGAIPGSLVPVRHPISPARHRLRHSPRLYAP